MELTLEQKRALALAAARKRAQQQSNQVVQSGSILPISKTAAGDVQFDSNAGLLGTIKRALTLPGDVMSGEVQMTDPATGRTSDEAIGRSLEMAATVSPVNPGVRAGDRAIPGALRATQKPKVPAPTAEDLLKAGGEGFDAMRATGAEYPPNAVKRMAETLMAKLNQDGFDDTTASRTFRTLGKLTNPPEGSTATIANLHSLRKTLGKIPNSPDNAADYSAARTAISELDDFIRLAGEKTPVDHPLAGPRVEASRQLSEANRNYAAGKRSDLITGIERASDLRAKAANSGQNSGNALRQRVASALLQPRKITGYSPEEVARLEGVVEGSRPANATRYIGNLLGGGGGLGQYLTGTLAAGGGVAATGSLPVGLTLGALPLVTGAVSKQTSNFLTRKALRNADEMIRMRSPLYERMLAETPEQVISPEKRAAIVRALLLSQQAGNQ